MMTRTLLARCAPLAIAASAALPAIPAAAQDAVTVEPVIVLPQTAPAPVATTAPAPTIVLPEPTAEPSTPVAATPADPAPVVTRTPARTAARQSIAPRSAAPAPSADIPSAAPVAAAPVAATVAAPTEPAPVASEAAPVAATSDATGEMAFAGLLGALGLAAVGGVAYAASRRRRRRALENGEYDDLAYESVDPVADEVVMEPAPQPVAATAIAPMPAPVFTAPVPASPAFAAPVVPAAVAKRPAARVSGDPIALPAEMPETFEERDALLKELVAAEPDKANPFTGVRARARRAKLIMQSLNRDFTSRKPRIDLSEYTNRWPALRGWQPATT